MKTMVLMVCLVLCGCSRKRQEVIPPSEPPVVHVVR